MNKETRKLFGKFCQDMAKTYGVEHVEHFFTATPTIQQKLLSKIVESSAFLQQINVIPVDEMEGQKILGGVTGVIGKRTDTNTTDRTTSDPMGLDPQNYKLYKTEYDVHITYAKIDTWAKFPNMQALFLEWVRKAIALARIKVGWYGTSAAAVTDPGTYTLGEDVNIGWFQALRDYNSGSQMMVEGGTTDEIRIGAGAGADYPNLDALVHDVKSGIRDVHRGAGDLKAYIGEDLLSQDKAQLYAAQGQTPTEKEKLEAAAVVHTYGGLPSATAPFFPARGLLITSDDNLSIYYQDGAVRQKIEDNAKRDRIEYYNSMNDGYVVETLDKAVGIEFANVKFWNGTVWG